MSWGGIGAHGALPDPGDPAATFPVHLARGRRRARLHPCVWGHTSPQTLQDGGETEGNYDLVMTDTFCFVVDFERDFM